MDAIYILPKYWILRYCSNKLKLKDWPHNVNVIILPNLKCTKNEIQVQPNVFQFNK